MAVVNNTNAAVMSTKTLINVNGNVYLNIKLFENRTDAFVWLQNELS